MAPPTFALVEWIGDEKPDCWQVIKTRQIQASEGEIQEGKDLDAIWKVGEETSVAKILKLGDSKPYLLTVKENEYLKPWRTPVLPAKRMSLAPKNLTEDFITGGDAESSAPAMNSKNLKRPLTSNAQTAKNQKGEKRKNTEVKKASKRDELSEEKGSSQSTLENSSEEVQQVLAQQILCRSREAVTPPLPGFPDVSAGKSPSEKNDKNTKEMGECCKVFQDRMDDFAQRIEALESQLYEIRKNVKKLKSKGKKVDSPQDEGSSSEIDMERACQDLVANSTSLFNTVNALMRKLFTPHEILSHSVSGKAPNSTSPPKPKFDANHLEMIRKIARDLHGDAASQTSVTNKIQAVQKAVKREHSSKQNQND